MRNSVASRLLRLTRDQRMLAIAMFSASLAIFYFTVVSIERQETFFFDLSPAPDGEEYWAGAVSLYRDGQFALHVAGRTVPPRYPFGFSLLMLPFLYCGFDPITVPFVANQVVGLALIFGLFLSLWKRGQFLAAGLSPLLLATLPAFIILCRSPMSEISGSAIVLAGFALLVNYLRSGNFISGLIGSAFFGIGFWFKVSSIIFGLAPAFAGLASPGRCAKRKLYCAAAFLATFLAGTAPLLWYNFTRLGNPISGGYSYWVPFWAEIGNAFNVAHLSKNLAYLYNEILQKEQTYQVSHMFGEGSYFGPALVILILVSVAFWVRSRIFWVLSSPVIVYSVAMCLYFFQDGRLLFPVLLVSLPLVAVTASKIILAHHPERKRNWAIRSCVALLLIGAVFGYPGNKSRPELLALFDFSKLRMESSKYAVVRHFKKMAVKQRVLILSDFSPSYVYALTEGDRIATPLHAGLVPREDPEWFSDADRAEQIKSALATGRSVYALLVHHPPATISSMQPPPEKHEWRTVYQLGQGPGIAKLIGCQLEVR